VRPPTRSRPRPPSVPSGREPAPTPCPGNPPVVLPVRPFPRATSHAAGGRIHLELTTMTRFTVLVAAPQTRSALRAAAVHTADSIAAHAGVTARIDVVDLAGLGPALLAEEATEDVAAALAALADSDVLGVATPQVHGSYSGLLKVFLDRLPGLGLSHVIALPLAVVDDLRNGQIGRAHV